jgi:hypothetical protein
MSGSFLVVLKTTPGEEGRKRHRLKFQLGILVGRRPDRPDSQVPGPGISSPKKKYLIV